MRVRHKPWAKEYILSDNELYINNYISDQKLDKLLSKYQGVAIEVGCGKGTFIYQKASLNPEILYIGIERQASIIVQASEKQEVNKLENLKYYYGDINTLIDNQILKNKVDVIYLNFSDPWPKTRHIKRRLTAPSFLNIYYQLLTKNGKIEQKTDNQGLFEYSVISLANDKRWIFQNIFIDLHNETKENIMTEYEKKFSTQGYKIKYIEVQKNNE
ncbi:MAG: tRNA (guanosine(46)-N7)-methyltransferase TrmB [Mycoplasmatales bacterium]